MKKRGKKIHWSGDGLNYTPCGLPYSTYYHIVSVDEFVNLEKKDRCETCNRFYNIHLENFLSIDTVYSTIPNSYRLILSCQYNKLVGKPYKWLYIKYIDFINDDISTIKNSYDWEGDITIHTGYYYNNNKVEMTTNKIKNIKILAKLIMENGA